MEFVSDPVRGQGSSRDGLSKAVVDVVADGGGAVEGGGEGGPVRIMGETGQGALGERRPPRCRRGHRGQGLGNRLGELTRGGGMNVNVPLLCGFEDFQRDLRVGDTGTRGDVRICACQSVTGRAAMTGAASRTAATRPSAHRSWSAWASIRSAMTVSASGAAPSRAARRPAGPRCCRSSAGSFKGWLCVLAPGLTRRARGACWCVLSFQ